MSVEILKGTTAVRIYCNGDGRIADAPDVSIYPWLKQYLTEYEYDPRVKRSKLKYQYFRYDKETGLLHLPINITGNLTEFLKSQALKYEIKELGANPADIVKADFFGNFERREYQEQAIDFLMQDMFMKALALSTGLGKTHIAIRTLLGLGLKSLIVLPAFLVSQWADVFSSVSNVKIVTLRGSKSIWNIINDNYETECDVVLASIKTLHEYAICGDLYQTAPSLQEFIRKMKFGIKIVDECHLNFYANALIDIQSDIKHNIYLSATHMRSSSNSERIFKKIYPDDIRYQGSKNANYINITEVRFSVGDIKEFCYMTPRGYSHFKYEKYLMKRVEMLNSLIEKVLEPAVDEHFIRVRKDGQKLLVLVALTEFGEILADWLTTRYPDLKVSTYFNNTSDDVLSEAEILVSTIGSCGTGKDISGLRTMILTNSFAAETQTLQTVGRLRKMEDTPEFIYLVNTAVRPQIRHSDIRRPIYKSIAKEFNSLVV